MKHTWVWAALALSLLLCGALPAQTAELPGDQIQETAQEEALWVRFDANGGRGQVPESLSVRPGESVILPSAELSVALGQEQWRFAGWSAGSGAASPDYRPGDALTVSGDVTLYAVYAQGEYQVAYRVDSAITREEVQAGETPAEVPQLPEGYMGWLDESGRRVDPAAVEIWADQTFTACQAVALNTTDHGKYMDGASDGLFYPDRSMTRAETAQVLYSLLAEKPAERVSYADVADGMWYTDAIGCLGALGVLDRPAGSDFQPDAPISRGDFARILSWFVPPAETAVTFSDVPSSHPAYEAVGTVAANGLFSGYEDGTFHPDAALTRAQAAVVFNNLLGREADTGTIASASNLRLFPDLPQSHWAYAQIMEATVSHTYTQTLGHEVWTQVTTERTALSDGYYRINGWLYRVQDGMFLHNTTVDGFTYDAQGRYTTGSAALDQQLNAIVEAYTNDSMTRDQKLRALYNYVRDNFTYLRRDLVSKGQTGWEAAYAEEFLKLGRGNCYSFSATFCLLSRELGLPAYTVVGGLGSSNSPHGWVEMELDGTVYMFDPQLEWRYLHDYGRTGYNLFKMLPSQARFTYIR